VFAIVRLCEPLVSGTLYLYAGMSSTSGLGGLPANLMAGDLCHSQNTLKDKNSENIMTKYVYILFYISLLIYVLGSHSRTDFGKIKILRSMT